MGFYDRRKRNKIDDSLQVDDWLMTYADMITLLLCFFAVFLSVSIPKKDVFDEARDKVLKEFAGPEKTGKFEDNVDILAGKFPPVVINKSPYEEDVPFENLPSIVHQFRRDGVTITQGDTVTTIDVNSQFFFASGSAALTDEGQEFLATLIAALREGQFKDYTITVEGHTDDNPINTPQFPSNWELSTARASSVVRYFIGQNISAQRLRAAGYADIFPKVPNRTILGKPVPENQSQNRRVVIKLEKIEKGRLGG